MWSNKLNNLLNKAIQHPDKREEIEKKIKDTYNQKCAFLVLDMCGFSKITHEHGIFEFLLMIQQMRLIATPIIKEHDGRVIKMEADNLFCLFAKVSNAFEASHEIIDKLKGTNNILPTEKYLYAAIGLGFGDILDVEGKDIFGDEINLACKLGEDIGEKNQILLTESAFKAFHSSTFKKKFKKKIAKISGVKFNYYGIEL
jgi:class 3 adenylate cyclase